MNCAPPSILKRLAFSILISDLRGWCHVGCENHGLLHVSCDAAQTSTFGMHWYWHLKLRLVYPGPIECQSSDMLRKTDPQLQTMSTPSVSHDWWGVQNDRKKTKAKQSWKALWYQFHIIHRFFVVSQPWPPKATRRKCTMIQSWEKIQQTKCPRTEEVRHTLCGSHGRFCHTALYLKNAAAGFGKNNAPQAIHVLTNWKWKYFNLLWFEGNCHEQVSKLRIFKSTHVGNRPNLEPLILRHGQSARWTRNHSKPNRSAPTEHRSPRSMMEDMMLSPMA